MSNLKSILRVVILIALAHPLSAIADNHCAVDGWPERPFSETGADFTSEEIRRFDRINDSIICAGNCHEGATKVAKYLDSGDRKYLKFGLREKYKALKKTIINAAGVGKNFATQITKDFEGFEYTFIEDASFREVMDTLSLQEPGAHMLVSGDLIERSFGHSFNLIKKSDGIIEVLDTYGSVSSYRVTNTGQMKVEYEDSWDYVLFKSRK